MKVAVLGCGPAGLLSAYAAELAGHKAFIYSIKQKSDMPGAMYVHEAIPGIMSSNVRRGYVHYEKLGDKQGYAKKVYGDPNAPCSWDSFPEGRHEAWSMPDIYDILWEAYERRVTDIPISRAIVNSLSSTMDKVISTVPAPVLCQAGHNFPSSRVVIDPQHRDVCEQLGDPCVIYNGQEHLDYYRTSLIFGHGATEYPASARMLGSRGPNGVKPLSTDCTCFPHVMRAGRFGKWEKGVLVHHAFREVLDALQ